MTAGPDPRALRCRMSPCASCRARTASASGAGITGPRSGPIPTIPACAAAASRTSSKRGSHGRMLRWLALAAVLVLADQAAKYAAMAYLEDGRRMAVTGFLNLVLVYNPG